jgi:hypothetical protein
VIALRATNTRGEAPEPRGDAPRDRVLPEAAPS